MFQRQIVECQNHARPHILLCAYASLIPCRNEKERRREEERRGREWEREREERRIERKRGKRERGKGKERERREIYREGGR